MIERFLSIKQESYALTGLLEVKNIVARYRNFCSLVFFHENSQGQPYMVLMF
jgi:hypothetical protein